MRELHPSVLVVVRYTVTAVVEGWVARREVTGVGPPRRVRRGRRIRRVVGIVGRIRAGSRRWRRPVLRLLVRLFVAFGAAAAAADDKENDEAQEEEADRGADCRHHPDSERLDTLLENIGSCNLRKKM